MFYDLIVSGLFFFLSVFFYIDKETKQTKDLWPRQNIWQIVFILFDQFCGQQQHSTPRHYVLLCGQGHYLDVNWE